MPERKRFFSCELFPTDLSERCCSSLCFLAVFGKVSGALSEHKNWTALSSEAPCRAPHYPLLTSSSGTLLHQDHRHDGDDVHVHSNHVLLFSFMEIFRNE